MPVKKEDLAQYVAELGLPQEQTDSLVATLMGNENAATQFVGQRLRHADYTRKSQEVAQYKGQLESQATEQITAYANQLAEAQNRITKIMADMEKEQISNATANARLRSVKEKYNLSDEDIPAIPNVTRPAGTGDPNPGQNPTIDLDKRLETFGNNLLKTIRQDMLSMPRVTAVQADISDEHKDLTGKRLSRSEMDELLKDAESRKVTLEQAWEDKFKIGDLRFQRRLDTEVKKRLDDAEAERKRKISEDALAGVRRPDPSTQNIMSPVLGRKFNESTDPAGRPPAAKSDPQPQPQPQPGVRVSGAERAAARFLERRANGVPMGAPLQVNSN